MSGTREGGKKAAAKTKELYGEDAPKIWGMEGLQARQNPTAPFAESRELASKAGKIGGQKGKRHRPMTLETKLKGDEWAFLLKMSNRAAGEIRLRDGSIDALDQHLVYHKIFEYWEKDDWQGAILDVCTHKDYPNMLRRVIEKEYEEYNIKVVGQPRRSKDRETLRVIRNVRAAIKLLLGD